MQEKKNLNTSNQKCVKTLDRVIILGIFIALFIISMIVIFCVFQSVPDTLIIAVLGSGTSEAVLTCIITCVKRKAGISDDSDSN